MTDAAAQPVTSRIADVLLPLALDTAYSYRVPDGLALQPGDVVEVPFGPRKAMGVVWGLKPGSGDNLKSVAGIVAAPALPDALRKLIDWVAWYTLAAKGSVLSLSLKLPDPDAGSERVRLGVRRLGPPPGRMTPARARVLATLESDLLVAKSELARMASVSVGVIDSLVDEGTLAVEAMPVDLVAPAPDAGFAQPALSPDQQEAARSLETMVAERRFAVALLEGVTGSGKTEVYFEAVAAALREGRQTLIMMPEIALTAQFTERFAQRFGVLPALWHSGVSGRKREKLHAALASGEARVVAGARSALFLPYRDLGLIIVDEEHEQAYKQDDGVSYHARDMAVVRGRMENLPVVLASATPSVESRVNAERGRYTHLRLPGRFGGRELPVLSALDLRREGPPARRMDRAPAGGRGQRQSRSRGAVAAVPQPARLCAADLVPGLRASVPVPELFGLAGRSPVSPRAGLPPLRPCRAPAEPVPGMPRRGDALGLRAGRGTARRGGRDALA